MPSVPGSLGAAVGSAGGIGVGVAGTGVAGTAVAVGVGVGVRVAAGVAAGPPTAAQATAVRMTLPASRIAETACRRDRRGLGVVIGAVPSGVASPVVFGAPPTAWAMPRRG